MDLLQLKNQKKSKKKLINMMMKLKRSWRQQNNWENKGKLNKLRL